MKTKILSAILLCLLVPSVHAENTPVSPANAVGPSHQAMFHQLSALAGTGNADAKYNLGMFYNNGIGTQRDNHAAFRYFSEAAQAGNLLAAYKVGCYYAGQFTGVVPTDAQNALKYKLRAAEAGYDVAQHDIALYFAREGDVPTALVWWEKAARQAHVPSTAYLAQHLSGVDSKDKVKAFAVMLVLREQMPNISKQLSDRIAVARTELSEDEKLQSERIRGTWLTGPTPLTTAARAGVTAVPALLGSLKQ